MVNQAQKVVLSLDQLKWPASHAASRVSGTFLCSYVDVDGCSVAMGHWCMENVGYLSGINNVHQHDSGLLSAFVHAVGGACWWICLTLYLSLLQDGNTALYFASQQNHVEVVKYSTNERPEPRSIRYSTVMYKCKHAVLALYRDHPMFFNIYCTRKTWDGLGTRLAMLQCSSTCVST